MNYKLVTTNERPDLIRAGDNIVEAVWPEFMLHDAVANKWFFQLYDDFPEFQYWLLDGEEIVGIGNSIPLKWNEKLENLPEEGWDWALEKGFRDKEKNIKPNLLCALSITINPKYQGKGISTEMIRSMVQIGKKYNLESLIIPVRPTLKKDYPLKDIKQYVTWKREDGRLFDPWLRVHEKLGGKIIKVCSNAMKISGTISDWENWTGMKFLESGEYSIPGALKPVEFDIKNDVGIYIEPNVWVKHKLYATNQVMPYHKKAMDEEWDTMFANPNFIFQKDQELDELNKIGIQGKKIAHLSCNNGIELMSLKRMGASRCVGFDISDNAIEEVRKRAERFNIDCEFVRTDVLEISEEFYGKFDLVYITVGTLVWIPDRKKYFEKAANLLAKDGQLFIYEHHPFGNVLPYDEEFEYELKVIHKYFDKEIWEENRGIDYYGGESYESSPSYEFPYTVSDLLNLIADSGFCLQKFNEYENDIALCRSYMEKQEMKFPLSYILVAKKL